jgi:hypothetical protein
VSSLKFSWASSRVNSLKCFDVSRTNSIIISKNVPTFQGPTPSSSSKMFQRFKDQLHHLQKCSDVSRTNSILIFRVVGGEWWPGFLLPESDTTIGPQDARPPFTTYNPEDEDGIGP